MKREYFIVLLSRYKMLSLWTFVCSFLIPMKRLYIIESSVLAGTDYWYQVFMLKNTLWQRKYPVSAASCVYFVCMFRECVCVCAFSVPSLCYFYCLNYFVHLVNKIVKNPNHFMYSFFSVRT